MRAPVAALSRALALALVGTAAASLAALLAPLGWPFELFAHFRWQLGAAALALLLASLVLRRPWMMVLALATLAVHALPAVTAGGEPALADSARCEHDAVTVATANLWFANTDHRRLVQWLDQSDADVIALQEVTPAWVAALGSMAASHPYGKVVPRDDPYGIALLSRWPLDRIDAVDLAADGVPSLVATINMRGRRVQVIALHTRWPVVRNLQQARDRSLAGAAQRARADGDPTILLGDLNLTPYAPAFGRLLAESGLRDAFADAAWRPTWQAGFWPLALPLDHVLVPAGSCIVARAIGPNFGSDHRPVRVSLRLPEA